MLIYFTLKLIYEKKLLFFWILLIVLLIVGFLTHKTTSTFNNYVETEVNSLEHEFGNIKVNDTINYTFKIKNISDYPFVITKIVSSCTCTIVNSQIAKIFNKDETVFIESQYIPKKEHVGKEIENVIFIECNSNKGIIQLKLKGAILP